MGRRSAEERHGGGDVKRTEAPVGESADAATDRARRIVESVPKVPANDRGNRNWRSVRLWAEAHSPEIMRAYDAVGSKTTTARLFGMRSLGPFYTACSRAGRWDLVPEGRRARVGAGVRGPQLESYVAAFACQ